jgi:hypothetical protein
MSEIINQFYAGSSIWDICTADPKETVQTVEATLRGYMVGLLNPPQTLIDTSDE